MIGRADIALILHPLNEPRGAVIADAQLPLTSAVTVRGSGLLNLAQQKQSLGGLTLAASAQLAGAKVKTP